MGKSLVDTRAVTRNKMRCPRSRTEKSYLSEKEWAELSEMVEILICPNIATVALQRRNLTPGECLLQRKQVVFKFSASSLKTFADERIFYCNIVGMFISA